MSPSLRDTVLPSMVSKYIDHRGNDMQKSFGLVRDASGAPKIEGDPGTLHPAIIAMLTTAERAALNIHTGAMAMCANGTVPCGEVSPGVFTALEPIVAVSNVFYKGVVYAVDPRLDVPAGGNFTAVATQT